MSTPTSPNRTICGRNGRRPGTKTVSRVSSTIDGAPTWSIDGVVLGRAGGGSVIKGDLSQAAGHRVHAVGAQGVSHASAHDMVARVEVMDELGLYAQILYPNAGGFGSQKFADVKDVELRRLCASIYNEAMIEIQENSGGRLMPMALLPWWDIDGSVAEAHRAAASGFHGITMCSDPQNRGLPDLGERVWDPLWEVLSEEQLSVNFHIGASQSSMTWFGDSPWPSLDDERKLALGSSMMYLSNARVIAQHHLLGRARAVPRPQDRVRRVGYRLDSVLPRGARLPAHSRACRTRSNT